MKKRTRRTVATIIGVVAILGFIFTNPRSFETYFEQISPETAATDSSTAEHSETSLLSTSATPLATEVLDRLEVKGRAPKTGYARTNFYTSWPIVDGCSLRQHIIKRELANSAVLDSEDNCTIISGEFDEPYTGSHLVFYQKSDLSEGLQIDHVVALSDAWQKGAQQLSAEKRYELATDPLNLLAVDAKTNQNKSDGDAATWLPPNKIFRCSYIARQISVKYKYSLWITSAEKTAMEKILSSCPTEPAVGISL